MRRFQYSLLALMLVTGLEPLAAETIKKTASGICHPPTSSYYVRTQNFRAYDSLGECLAGGGRLPKQLAISDSPKSSQNNLDSYERSALGHGWEDVDGDCQDSRAEALIVTSSTEARFATEKRCRVISGRWVSPFTGNVLQNSRDIDIDHVFSTLVTRNISVST